MRLRTKNGRQQHHEVRNESPQRSRSRRTRALMNFAYVGVFGYPKDGTTREHLGRVGPLPKGGPVTAPRGFSATTATAPLQFSAMQATAPLEFTAIQATG